MLFRSIIDHLLKLSRFQSVNFSVVIRRCFQIVIAHVKAWRESRLNDSERTLYNKWSIISQFSRYMCHYRNIITEHIHQLVVEDHDQRINVFLQLNQYFFGKHKLCPKLSPKKTIEGAVGGVIFTVLVSGFFGVLFAPDIVIHCIFIGIIGSSLSMCGDLVALALKRKMGIKDYGKLIPGHGGILDRFDSVLFTAPVVYYYTQLVLIR